MARSYDLVVIGTGTAASVAAKQCRAAGWSVAVIDHRPFGGTCALRGCDPKKVLLAAAEAVDAARRLEGKGVCQRELGIDWPSLMAFKRGFTEPVPEGKAESFAEQGIEAFRGEARFTGRNAVSVDDELLEGRHILIAAGAKPMPLGIEGEEHLATSDDFLDLDDLPRRIVLVGGGYIAFEFAHLARRAGAKVTILEQGPDLLAPFDRDLVTWLVDRSHDLGIEACTETAVEAVARDGNGFTVRTSGNGGETFAADLVVHAAGRVPALDPADLDAAGVAHDKGRLELNDFLQSVSNPLVYAAGDAAQLGPALTPVANRDGAVAAENMLQGNRRKVDYSNVPSVVFTLPPLASVGLGEAQAKKNGLDVHVSCQETAKWYVNRRVNEEAGGFKVLTEADSGRLLGAHLLGPGAEELINIFALALQAGLSAEQLKSAFFAYPTSASNLDSMLSG